MSTRTKSHAEIDAGKWIRAAVNFFDVFGGEGDMPCDRAEYEQLFLSEVTDKQLDGHPPASTPDEMFPYLIELAGALFLNAIYVDPACQVDDHLNEVRTREVLDRLAPPPPERRYHPPLHSYAGDS